MANVKNFGLIGVGENVQFGKAGPSLSKQGATVLRADGSAAFMVPVGDNSARPAGSTGMIRFNTEGGGNVMEYFNGSIWSSLATGGAAVTSVNGTLNRVTSSNTGAGSTIIDIAATYVGQTSITTLGTVTTGTWNGTTIAVANGGTGATTLTSNGVLLGNGTSAVTATAEGATGQVLVGNTGSAPTWSTLTGVAVTSFQTSLVGLTPSSATNGAVTLAGILGGASGGTGVNNGTDTITTEGNVNFAGSFTTTGANALSIATTGATSVTMPTSGTLLTTGDTTNYVSSIAGTAGNITVSGSTGAVTVNLVTAGTPVSDSFVKITTDTFGRVTATSAVATADITALVDATYVNVIGDTMTGNLVMSSAEVTGLPATPSGPTAAASKAYVDALVSSGATWANPIVDPDLVDVVSAQPGSPTTGTGYIKYGLTQNETWGTLTNVVDMDYVYYTGTDWIRVDVVTAGDRFIIAGEHGTIGANLSGVGFLNKALLQFVSGNPGLFASWTQPQGLPGSTLTNGTTVLVNDPESQHFGHTYLYELVANVWVEIAGPGSISAGIGLSYSGNVLNVNLGAGIVQLPSDEVGIDLYDSANNPLILTTDGSTRVTTTGAKLGLLLDGSSLSMSTTGLRVAANGVDLTTMVTGVLPSANGGTGVNNGASTITLGGSLTTVGAFTSSFTMSGNTAVTFPTSGTLLSTANIAANAVTSITFGSTGLTPNTATSGAVSVGGTLVVANGGTGASTLLDTAVLIGNGTGVVEATTALTFATDTLTIGTTTIQGLTGGDTTITATATNADINLIPNGTGAVIIGPAGAGLIQSDSGQPLTVRGNTFLTLESVTGGTVMALPTGTGSKVSISGPTAADYATGLAANDLVNKQYVDTIAGSAAGDVKAFKQVVSLGADAATNIGSVLPTGATILSVKVNVTTVNTTSTLEVGISGTTDAYMSAAENDPQTVGLYLAECMVVNSAVQIIATVAGQTGGVGSATVVVTYQIAN